MTDKNIREILCYPEVNSDAVKKNLNTPHDAVAYVMHLMMIQHGFRCVGLSEKQDPKEMDDQFVLPEDWNLSPDVYSFKYKHKQSSLNFVLKCVTLGGKLLVNGLVVEDSQHYGIEVNVSEYFTSNENAELLERYKNIEKLEALFKNNISNKMVPFQHKEGYEEAVAHPSALPNNQPQRPTVEPSREQNPPRGRNDDYDPLRIGPPRRGNIGIMPGYGSSDLYPNIGGPLGGLGGYGGGGMHVGPNHPGFGGIGGVGGPPRYGFGGNGLLPPGVPHGARYDPIGPLSGGRPNPGRPGGSWNPNPDHMRPPQFNEDDTNDNPYWM